MFLSKFVGLVATQPFYLFCEAVQASYVVKEYLDQERSKVECLIFSFLFHRVTLSQKEQGTRRASSNLFAGR